MPYFAAVAAVRIQGWIARTPDLRFVRGASAALTQESTQEALSEHQVLPQGVMVDPATAQVAGVFALRADDADRLDQGVDLLLTHLQARLPGVEWTAWRTEAPSYVNAYDAVHGRGEQKGEVRWWPRTLPLALHLPFAAACARCAHELATDSIRTPDGQGSEGVGPDCRVRHQTGTIGGFRDFSALATVGAQGQTIGRRDAANHLATVTADGNRVGDFFTQVAALKDPQLQAALSRALDSAARQAAEQAAACGPDGTIVAMTHFVGGDDIFASVAAPFAWTYVETLARVFEETFRAGVAAALPNPGAADVEAVRGAAEQVSLGIGVAFAHAKHPIADCRESALAAEKHAKSATQGREGAVAWVDITVEPSVAVSGELPSGRWVATSRLSDELGTDHPVLTMESSGRKMLESLLRQRPEESADAVAAGARAWAERVGRMDELRGYLPDEAGGDPVRMIADLRHTVDRARWWPRPVTTRTPGDEELQ